MHKFSQSKRVLCTDTRCQLCRLDHDFYLTWLCLDHDFYLTWLWLDHDLEISWPRLENILTKTSLVLENTYDFHSQTENFARILDVSFVDLIMTSTWHDYDLTMTSTWIDYVLTISWTLLDQDFFIIRQYIWFSQSTRVLCTDTRC